THTFLSSCYADHRRLHSFPTRRSSDLRRMSGWMPIDRRSRTLCCVGLVLSSPAVPMNGTSVRWMYNVLSRPTSRRNCRIASRKRSEEHTSELSHVAISYAVFCLKKKKK